MDSLSRLQCLNVCRKILLTINEEQTLFDSFLKNICDSLGYELTYIALKEPNKNLKIVSSYGSDKDYLNDLILSWGDDINGKGPAGMSVKKGKSVSTHVNNNEFSNWRILANKYNFKSITCVPLVTNLDTYGTIGFYSSSQKIEEEELEFLNMFASDLAGGIESIRREKELKRLQDFLIQTNESAKVGGWEVDIEKNEVIWGDVTRMIHECPPGYIPNLNDGLSFYKEGSDRNTIEQTLKKCTRDGDGWDLELRIVTTKKNEKWIRTIGNVEVKNGKPVRFFGSFQDITERKLLEIRLDSLNVELQEQNIKLQSLAEEAEASRDAKSDFLANMSHEIRTPMNGVLGMTSLLLQTELNSDQRSTTEIIETSAQSLMTILNDILDFSKIESGKINIEKIEFNLEKLIEDVVTSFYFVGLNKNIEVVSRVSVKLDHLIMGDEGRLRQIINNLIGNAVKFSDKGTVLVEADIEQKGNNEYLSVKISDEGIGLSKEQQKAIFERFAQGNNSTSRKFGGTGLGLTISKELVHLMGGSIDVESSLNKGSTFCFEIPIEKTKYIKSRRIINSNKDLYVSIIIKNKNITKMLSESFKSWKFTAIKEHSSVEDFLKNNNYLENSVGNKHIVILDIPSNSTIDEFLQKFTEIENKKYSFLLLSSCAINTSSYGIKFQPLLKPCTRTKLLNSLSCFLDIEAGISDDKGFKNNLKLKGNVLVVDDNVINQKVAKKMLSKIGLIVDTVASGLEAIQNTKSKQYDLILMDCHMPTMDGWETTKEIRKNKRYSITPIIALSADLMKESISKSLESGMNDYLTKPIIMKDLYKKLCQHISYNDN